jgi:hypothetical protein
VAKKPLRRTSARPPRSSGIVPTLKPIIKPVVQRLDTHETLLLELKAALEVQFRRIAAIQAQLDQLLATRR